MDLGAHLPLIGFTDEPWTLDRLQTYATAVEQTGYAALAANDHFLFPRPWLDGPTVLAAVLGQATHIDLMTTVLLPVLRGTVASAKAIAAIDILSGGRLIVGVGPGSSADDYAAAGVSWEDRWRRIDAGVLELRAFLNRDGTRLTPAADTTPPLWIGSWGSDAGLRRVARLADGWLASAYNTTPARFAQARQDLAHHLAEQGKGSLPNALSTMICYVTEDRDEADRVLHDLVGRAFHRPVEELGDRLLIGPAAECAEKLSAFAEAGVQRIFVWPVTDELHQLDLVRNRVAADLATWRV